jgi:hypothetical protein
LPFENEAFQAGSSDDDTLYQTASEASFEGKSDGAQFKYYTPGKSPLSSQAAVSGLSQQTSVQSISINLTFEKKIYLKSKGIEGMKVFEDSDCVSKEANDNAHSQQDCEGVLSEEQSLKGMIRNKIFKNEVQAPEWATQPPAQTPTTV